MGFGTMTSSRAGWRPIIQVVTNQRVRRLFDTSLPRNVSQQNRVGSVQQNPRHRESGEDSLAQRYKSLSFYGLRLK
jgi:hypothetical protein